MRDDGSTDHTQQILEQYQSEGKLIWYTGENLGPAKSFMNLLYNCGDFDYYAFSDQDDVWDKDKLNAAIVRIRNISKPCCYYCNAQLADSKCSLLGENLYKKRHQITDLTYLCSPGVIGCSMVLNHNLVQIIRSKLLVKDIGMHDLYISKICAAVGGTIVYDDRTHFKYRQHNDNVIGVKTGIKDKILDRLNIVKKKSDCPIDKQASEIIINYDDIIPVERKRELLLVEDYNKRFINRIILLTQKNLKFPSLNSSITNRAAILFGKRYFQRFS